MSDIKARLRNVEGVGTTVSLDKLCRTEPEWAANCIRQTKAEIERLRTGVAIALAALDEGVVPAAAVVLRWLQPKPEKEKE